MAALRIDGMAVEAIESHQRGGSGGGWVGPSPVGGAIQSMDPPRPKPDSKQSLHGCTTSPLTVEGKANFIDAAAPAQGHTYLINTNRTHTRTGFIPHRAVCTQRIAPNFRISNF